MGTPYNYNNPVANKGNLADQTPFTVYVVDDLDATLETTKLQLQGYTFNDHPLKLVTFTDSASTIKALENDDPTDPEVAVIILDIMMPVEDFKVIEYLRKIQDNHTTQIIIRTGFAGKILENANKLAKDYEINDFIDKSDNTDIRIQTSVTTSLRAYILLKELAFSNLSIDILSTSLLQMMNLAKDDKMMTMDEKKMLVSNIFLYYGKSTYRKTAKPSEEAINYLAKIESFNLVYIFYVITKIIKNPKIRTIDEGVVRDNMIVLQIQWCEGKEKARDLLFNRLRYFKDNTMVLEVNFIDPATTPDIFNAHHNREIPEKPILWRVDLGDLLYLYYRLVAENFLKRVVDHGVDKTVWSDIHNELPCHYIQGPPKVLIKADTLSTTKGKYKSKDDPMGVVYYWDTKYKPIIDKIIDEMLKLKE